MVKDHKKDIKEFENAAKKGSGPAPIFVNEKLPTLRKHLETSQALVKGK